jgi:hypothetical protein
VVQLPLHCLLLLALLQQPIAPAYDTSAAQALQALLLPTLPFAVRACHCSSC